jgi:hypothetical protein
VVQAGRQTDRRTGKWGAGQEAEHARPRAGQDRVGRLQGRQVVGRQAAGRQAEGRQTGGGQAGRRRAGRRRAGRQRAGRQVAGRQLAGQAAGMRQKTRRNTEKDDENVVKFVTLCRSSGAKNASPNFDTWAKSSTANPVFR